MLWQHLFSIIAHETTPLGRVCITRAGCKSAVKVRYRELIHGESGVNENELT